MKRIADMQGVTNFDTITPTITPVDGSYRRFRIETAVSYDVGFSRSGVRIRVPKGFITDFASIPRMLWSIYPPMGRYAPAAIVHDWLYGTHSRTRKESDKIFLEAMKVLGVPYFRRHVMYRAVRMFGGGAYKQGGKTPAYEV